LVFVDASEDSIMADDVVTFSNPLIMLVEEKEFEETLLDVNVSQRSCDEKLFQKMVRTQIHCSAWDHQSSPNPHTLTIYLEFVPTCEVAPERLKNVNVKMTMFIFIVKLGFSVMAITIGYKA